MATLRRMVAFAVILLSGSPWVCRADAPTGTTAAATIEVTNPKNIELMCLLINLTDYWDTRHSDFPMAAEIRERFLPFQNHPAVAATQAALDKGWWHIYFCYLALYVSDFPEAAPVVDSTDPYWQQLASPEVMQYIGIIRQFHDDSDFPSFWSDVARQYEHLRKHIEKRIEEVDITGTMEKFYGTAFDRYFLIPSPQMPCMGLHVERTVDDRRHAFCVVGACSAKEGDTYFCPAEPLVTDFVFHELSHSFIEPLLERHSDLLEGCAHLHEKAGKEKMAVLGYDTWDRVFIENLIHAVQARLAGTAFGPEACRRSLADATESGFVLVNKLDEILDGYVDHRDTYRAFADFMPEIFTRLGCGTR